MGAARQVEQRVSQPLAPVWPAPVFFLGATIRLFRATGFATRAFGLRVLAAAFAGAALRAFPAARLPFGFGISCSLVLTGSASPP
jgi:hypothetical protein